MSTDITWQKPNETSGHRRTGTTADVRHRFTIEATSRGGYALLHTGPRVGGGRNTNCGIGIFSTIGDAQLTASRLVHAVRTSEQVGSSAVVSVADTRRAYRDDSQGDDWIWRIPVWDIIGYYRGDEITVEAGQRASIAFLDGTVTVFVDQADDQYMVCWPINHQPGK